MVEQKLSGRSALITRVGRWLALCLAAFALATLIGLLYCEHGNSRDVPFPTQAELRSSLDRSTAWILRNRAAVLNENNSMLWLFVREAGRLSNDARLQSLAREYQARSTDGTLSQFFFDSSGIERVREASIVLTDEWQGYQRMFVYGATCNIPLRSDPEVLGMLDPAACERDHLWLRNPWCRTHQLMGFRFVQKNHCEPEEDTAGSIRRLQNGILSELRWDFRVEDAYLQKVWTLIESGRRDDIRPVWVRRILDAQRPDGGWDGVDVVAPLPGGRGVFWLGGLHPRVGQLPPSNFHATAQGLYLMALLLQAAPDAAP